jgi:hypothetical protein
MFECDVLCLQASPPVWQRVREVCLEELPDNDGAAIMQELLEAQYADKHTREGLEHTADAALYVGAATNTDGVAPWLICIA